MTMREQIIQSLRETLKSSPEGSRERYEQIRWLARLTMPEGEFARYYPGGPISHV